MGKKRSRTRHSDIAMTRGMNPLAALSFVRENHGPTQLENVLKSLEGEDIAILTGKAELKSNQWIPYMVHARLLETIDKVCGIGDYATLYNVGRHMSARDVPRFFRPLIRLGNPGWILEVSTRLWRMYHNKGYWEVQRTPVTILATLNDHEECHTAFCHTFVGWLTGALELSGGYDVMVDHPVCQARGAPNCVFTARWVEKSASNHHREKTVSSKVKQPSKRSNQVKE
tara:strand:+ start:414 stop:1097 length:684 start_codon:yes stop_codon:yes gene_type:complete